MAQGPIRPGDRVRVVRPRSPQNLHLHAFDEVAASLTEALSASGVHADLSDRVAPGRTNVIFGSHLLGPDDVGRLPAGAIVYNLEQIEERSALPPSRLSEFRHTLVWDYSRRNVARWAEAGIEARLVPIGWSPGLAVIDRSAPRDIDVLFYGSINGRRRAVLEALTRRGVRVEAVFGVYAAERDALIARARLVLNIQYYEARILEMVRLSYLFANGVPVVSETVPHVDAPGEIVDAAAFVTYDRLVDTTIALIADDAALAELGERGRRRMEALPWSVTLAGAAVLDDPPSRIRTSDRSADGLVLRLRVCPDGDVAAGGPVHDLVGSSTTSVLEHSGIDRSTLGPPPVFDTDEIGALAEAVVVPLRDALARDEGAVVTDGGLAHVLPFWLAVADAAGVAVAIELVVLSPVRAAQSARETGVDPVAAVLRWLSCVLFGEAESRGRARTLAVAPGVPIPRELHTHALVRAEEVRSALAADPPDLETVDGVAADYLAAMSWYVPILNRRDARAR